MPIAGPNPDLFLKLNKLKLDQKNDLANIESQYVPKSNRISPVNTKSFAQNKHESVLFNEDFPPKYQMHSYRNPRKIKKHKYQPSVLLPSQIKGSIGSLINLELEQEKLRTINMTNPHTPSGANLVTLTNSEEYDIGNNERQLLRQDSYSSLEY